eukprot:1246550-Prymnesium_polylepis.1
MRRTAVSDGHPPRSAIMRGSLLVRSAVLTGTAAALLTGTGVSHHMALLPPRGGPLVRASLWMSSAGKRAARRQRRPVKVADGKPAAAGLA